MKSFQGRCEIRKGCELTVWEKSAHSLEKAKLSLWDTEGNQGKKKSQFFLLGVPVCLVSAVEKGIMNVTLHAVN